MAEPKGELDDEVELIVDGASLPMVPFVRKLIAATVIGIVGALRGGEQAREIEIRLRRRG